MMSQCSGDSFDQERHGGQFDALSRVVVFARGAEQFQIGNVRIIKVGNARHRAP